MFTLVHDNKGETPAVEKYPKGDAAIAVGQPLKFNDGKLVDVGGATTKPTYIAQQDAAASDDEVFAVKVTPAQIWRTTYYNASTTAFSVGKPGATVKLGGASSTYGNVINDTTSGVATVLWVDGGTSATSGAEVHVCFN